MITSTGPSTVPAGGDVDGGELIASARRSNPERGRETGEVLKGQLRFPRLEPGGVEKSMFARLATTRE
jgi:hypothetical protein